MPEPAEDDAVVVVRERMIGAERERLAVALGRPGKVLERRLHAAEIDLAVRGARLDLQSFGEDAHATMEIAALAGGDAEHVHRIKLTRIVAEHQPIELLGPDEIAGTMGGHRLVERGDDEAVGSVTLLRCFGHMARAVLASKSGATLPVFAAVDKARLSAQKGPRPAPALSQPRIAMPGHSFEVARRYCTGRFVSAPRT